MNKRTFIKSFFILFMLLFKPKLVVSGEKLIFNAKKKKLLLNRTKIITDQIFLKHHIDSNHPESPDRIRFIQKEIINNNYQHLRYKPVKRNDLEKWVKEIHTKSHIDSIKKNNLIAYKVSMSAVNSCLTATDIVVEKKNINSFCAIRPPGHHALNSGKEEGFCYFNNVAITAKYIQKKYKIKKILILDWDYHHGNSTEFMFYDDPSVLFFSTHDQFAYPGTGDPRKVGVGKGKGYNINIHMDCGSNDSDIIEIYKKFLIPKVENFKPEFILISAGFDSRKDDTLGCFEFTDNGFAKLTKIVMDLAKKYCDNKIVSVLEGGYNVKGNAKAVISHIKVLNEYK